MDKDNIFCSTKFHMDADDVLHILVKDLTGVVPVIELYDNDGNVEDVNGIVVNNSDVLFVSTENPAKVYLYNVGLKTSTLLTISDITMISADIAHTQNKLWLYNGAGIIKEWDVTLYPFSATYNRTITNFNSTAGLGTISDIILISYKFVGMASSQIYEADITNLVAVNTLKFESLPGRFVTGDYILTTTNKLIILEYLILANKQHIVQYDYLTGNMEVDLDISSVFSGNAWSFGLFEFNSEIYIAGYDGPPGSLYGVIYKIDKNAPYALTLYDTTTYAINGASQVPEQLTVHFT